MKPTSSTGFDYSAKLKTPFAVLGIRATAGAVVSLTYLPRSERAQAARDAFTHRVVAEIERYLEDPEFRFTVPLAPAGTLFQRRVWAALRDIPLGESRTYGEIARAVHSAPRAIGQACGANHVALIIPCHRVVAAKGSLGGFMNQNGGDPVAIKRWLLQHEGYRFGA